MEVVAKVTASFSFMRYYTEPSEEWTRYYIYVDTDADTMERLNARYQTLIS